MPQAAAGALVMGSASATFFGVGGALATGIGTAIAYAAVYIVVSAAISYAFAAITKSLTASGADLTNEASARQTVVRSASESRRLLYGKVRVAGPLVFATTTGVDNAFLHLVIAIAGSEITAVDEIWFDDTMLPAGSGVGDVTTGKFAGVARVLSHLGQPGQTVDTFLQTDVGTTLWDSTHVLSDTAYLYVRLKWNQTVYPSGIPRIAAVVRGRKIYDPRVPTTAYSTNSALVIRDYLTHPNGLRCALADIDDATFITAAGICDESITLNPTGAQVRYDANGSIPLDMPHKTAMDQLLTSCAGYLVYAQGVYRMYAGAYRSPTVTLTEDNMSGPISISPRVPRADLFNAVRGQFVNPNASWQAVDFPPIKNSGYQTQDGGEQIFADLALPFTTNPARAQRLAKIMLEKSRQSTSVVFQGNLTCFKVQPCDTVMLTIDRLGWVNQIFQCVGWTFAETGQVILALQKESSTVYAWTGGSETLIDTAPTTNLPNPLTVAAPTGFVVTSTNEFLVEGNGQVTTRLKLTWVAPVDTYVTTSGRIEVQYRRDPDTNWLTAPPAPGNATVTWLAPIQPGGTYDIQIRAINSLEIASAWVVASNHVAAAPTFSDNSDNLIPNPNSEVGTPALNTVPDGVGLVTDAANAYAGQWVRRFTAIATVQTALMSAKLAATAGDQYYFEAFLKGTTAHVSPVNILIQYFDAAGTLTTSSATTYTPTTTYTRISVAGTVPVASTAIRAAVSYGSAGDTGKNLYVDNMYMRRMVNGAIIQDESVSASQLTNGYNADNMIPNANSELGLLAVDLVPEGNGLFNDAANSFAGSWCRRVTVAGASANVLVLTGYIPVSPGESFLFEGYLKMVAAQVTNISYLAIELTDANKVTPITLYSEQSALTITYKKFTVQTVVPPGKLFMRAYIGFDNPTTLNTGKLGYGDSFLLKRLVTGAQDSNVYSDNLVVNGSFERGAHDYQAIGATVKETWTSVIQPGDAPEGNYCLRLNAPNASFGAGLGFGAVLRAFPLTPGDTYNVRCKIRHSNGNGTHFLRVFESATQPPTGFIGDGVVSSHVNLFSTLTNFQNGVSNAAYTAWSTMQFVYTPVSTARWASFAVYNWGGSTGTLDIDEVEIRRQVGTHYVEDNAITLPSISQAGTLVNLMLPAPTAINGFGYRTNIWQIGTIASSGGRVKVDASGSFSMQTAAGGPGRINIDITRVRPSVAVSTTTTTIVTSPATFTVVTSAPHNLVVNDNFYFGGTPLADINTTSTLARAFSVVSVVSATSFTTSSGGAFVAIATPLAGTVYSGGFIYRFDNITGAVLSSTYALVAPVNTTFTVRGSIATVDNPPSAGNWTYYAVGETINGTTPISAHVAHRMIELLEIKK